MVVIGISLPITGAYADAGAAARDGVEVAIENMLAAYPMSNLRVETRVLDHGTTDGFDADRAEADMKTLVGDDAVVAVVRGRTTARWPRAESPSGTTPACCSARWAPSPPG